MKICAALPPRRWPPCGLKQRYGRPWQRIPLHRAASAWLPSERPPGRWPRPPWGFWAAALKRASLSPSTATAPVPCRGFSAGRPPIPCRTRQASRLPGKPWSWCPVWVRRTLCSSCSPAAPAPFLNSLWWSRRSYSPSPGRCLPAAATSRRSTPFANGYPV